MNDFLCILVARNDFIRSNPVLAARVAARRIWSNNRLAIGDKQERLGRTLRLWADKWNIFLRAEVVREFEQQAWIAPGLVVPDQSPRPGVVGLLMPHESPDDGFVVPLSASCSSKWEVVRPLPFLASELVIGLGHLAAGSGLPGVVPEAFPFRVCGSFEVHSSGNSMTVAGLMAIVASVNPSVNTCDVLRGVAVVVESSAGGELSPVRGEEVKLRAFIREYGRGSLLIRHPNGRNDFDDKFDLVWETRNLRDLAGKLSDHGLLSRLLVHQPLTSAELERGRSEIAAIPLEFASHRLAAAQRLAGSKVIESLPLRLKTDVFQLLGDTARSCGRWSIAKNAAVALCELLEELGSDVADDARASVHCDLAAAYFQEFRFHDAATELEPWLSQIDSTPRAFSPVTRWKVWNTLGRVKVATGATGWEELFRRSMALQAKVEPEDAGRSRNYLIHALARMGRRHEALRLIDDAEADIASNPVGSFGWQYLQFYRARAWAPKVSSGQLTDPLIEAYHNTACGMLVGPGPQSAELFRHASQLYVQRADADCSSMSLLQLFKLVNDLGVAAVETAGWPVACQSLREYLHRNGHEGMRDHLGPAVQTLGSTPNWDATMTVFQLIPYF